MLFKSPVSDAEILSTMLSQLDHTPEKATQVHEWIDARFGQTAAIVIIDMCGFSRTAEEHGIIEFLRRMHEVQGVILPIIREHAGMVINTLADSLACLFPTVPAALEASVSMILELDKHNLDYPEAPNHYLSVGIGYGRILVFDKRDAFGPEMNRAGKLGEDEAGSREILLTPSAVQELPEGVVVNAKTFTIGGRPIVTGVVDLEAWVQR